MPRATGKTPSTSLARTLAMHDLENERALALAGTIFGSHCVLLGKGSEDVHNVWNRQI